VNSAETNAVRNFLTGLKSDIYTRIYPRDPINLNNAIESAIRAETDYNEHTQRMRITEGLMQTIRCNNCLLKYHTCNGNQKSVRTAKISDTSALNVKPYNHEY